MAYYSSKLWILLGHTQYISCMLEGNRGHCQIEENWYISLLRPRYRHRKCGLHKVFTGLQTARSMSSVDCNHGSLNPQNIRFKNVTCSATSGQKEGCVAEALECIEF